MVCVNNGIFTQLRGKLAGMVFFTRWGRTYARKAASKASKSPTPLQRLQCNRMSDAVTFYGIIRNTFLVTGWREAAKGQPYSGMNLLIRRNIGGFDGYGQVTDYTRLHFATGPLPVCDCPRAVYDAGERKIQLSWQNRTPLNPVRMDDRLFLVVVNEAGGFTVFSPEQLQYSRRECAARIALSGSEGIPRWVYVAFTDRTGKIFSDDIACPLDD